jgi:hypothetical protein
MRLVLTALLAAGLLSACGDSTSTPQSADETPPPTTATRATSPSPDPVASAAAAAAADGLTAVRICTTQLPPVNERLLAAVEAARGGTRSEREILDIVQGVQDDLEALGREVPDRYPSLSSALQAYADALGRARVSGDDFFGPVAAAVEAVNAACDNPSGAP